LVWNEVRFMYAYWKIIAWRFIRAGLAGGISTATVVSVVLKPDLSNFKIWALALGSAFLAGFISALFLTIRDTISDGDQKALINKLPL